MKLIKICILCILIIGCAHDYANIRRTDIVDDIYDNLQNITTEENQTEVEYIKKRIAHLVEDCK